LQHLLLPVNIQISKIDFCIAQNAVKRFALEQNLWVVGLDRIELSTSPLSGVRSSQLSYRPGLRLDRAKRCKTLCAPDSSGLRWLAFQSRSSFNMVELVGIEPATS
jgi:hypothetical protein